MAGVLRDKPTAVARLSLDQQAEKVGIGLIEGAGFAVIEHRTPVTDDVTHHGMGEFVPDDVECRLQVPLVAVPE